MAGRRRRDKTASITARPAVRRAGASVEDGPEEWRRTRTSEVTQRVETISRRRTGPMIQDMAIPEAVGVAQPPR